MDLPGTAGITAIPTGCSLGADIAGVDLAQPLDAVTLKAIEAA